MTLKKKVEEFIEKTKGSCIDYAAEYDHKSAVWYAAQLQNAVFGEAGKDGLVTECLKYIINELHHSPDEAKIVMRMLCNAHIISEPRQTADGWVVTLSKEFTYIPF